MSAQAWPDVVVISAAEMQASLDRARVRMEAHDYEVFEAAVRTLQRVLQLVDERNVTLAKLRQMLFGTRSERKEKVFPKGPEESPQENLSSSEEHAASEKRKGHGRNGAAEFAGGERISVPHPGMSAGCACPECAKGKVYPAEPGHLLRIVGGPPLLARVYEPARWRCNLCGQVFTAPLPPEVGEKKYDETAGSMLALLKYGSGMPFHRLERLQESLQVPLPAATQWEIVKEVAAVLAPVWEALLSAAAQGQVLHNDDTTMRVLSLREENDSPDAPERKGVFTSGIVSVRDGRRVAMFFTGRKHAGERLADLLRRRAAALGAPIQMCDGLSRNLPKAFAVILSNCLAHGRRKFVEQATRFPAECRYVLEQLAEVYHNDALAAERHLTPEERLFFHQSASGPVMEALRAWMEQQLADKKVEPNSGLGQAIEYMRKRWDALTLFLRQAGAPLDNNLCEQALKMTILHRKNALFYRTENGARVGDILMSLIHTCRLNGVNPFAYLTALQQHAEELRRAPAKWLPWNYHEQLASAPTDTS